MPHFSSSVDLPATVEQAFAYHERPGALRRLIPPWENVRIEHSDGSLQVGSRVVMRIRAMGVPVRWTAEHTEYDPPHLFVDTQRSGPFTSWVHRHQFAAGNDSTPGGGCRLTDDITYQLPAGALGQAVGGGAVARQLQSMFAYRHAVTAGDLKAFTNAPLAPSRIGVSGSSGLVGRDLCAFLTLGGHQVEKLVRSETEKPTEIYAWGDASDCRPLDRLDAVIHLAGYPIAGARWNDEVKQKIRDSRVKKTRELCQKLAALAHKPSALLCASAIGIYGDRGDELLDEDSRFGDGFLDDVAREWEQACQPAVEAGIRVVHLRFGLILSPRDGALAKMLLPTKLGGGGPLGDGNQWWSWIAIDDCVRAIYHCLARTEISGAVNFAAPSPVRNNQFASTLGEVLHRPSFLPMPATLLRTALGEMADDLLLSSSRVVPRRLQETGFEYQFADLQPALRHLLGRTQ
jgi:uncharacterized protein (TIGR01777 family)